MINIFYWSPHLSNVATITNVVNSANSLKRYNQNLFKVRVLDVAGEWMTHKKRLFEKDIDYQKIGSLNLSSKLPVNGFLKSRFIFTCIFLKSFFPLLSLLRKQKPDYIIIHLLTSLPLFLLIFFKFDTKFILRISGLPKLNFIRKIFWRIVSNKIYKITCPSQETLDFLIRSKVFNADKLIILYDPIINVSEIRKKKNKRIDTSDLKKNYLLSIGRLTKQKNHKLLIDAFSLLDKNDNNYLYIIGDGEERNNLLIKIKELNLEKKIFLLGFKENIYPYVSASIGIISCSLWEDPGAVMVESAFCNKIVLSSNCRNGPKEFLMNGKAGHLFKNDDISSLKKNIEKLINENQNEKYLKTVNAKINSKNYTLFNHYKTLEKILI
jgi:glycosyltransferase involved in cell wall biosynthesis